MTYLLISKILREKLLNFKVGAIVNYPKHKRRKEKKIQKVNPQKLYVKQWIFAQQSWLNQ